MRAGGGEVEAAAHAGSTNYNNLPSPDHISNLHVIDSRQPGTHQPQFDTKADSYYNIAFQARK